MYEGFNEHAMQAITAASNWATRLGHQTWGCAHLVPGLLSCHDSIAAGVLERLDLGGGDIDAVARYVNELEATAVPDRVRHLNERERRELRTVWHRAQMESLNNGDSGVGPEHLLLALCHPESPNGGRQVLEHFGLNPEQVRQILVRVMRGESARVVAVIR